MAYFGNNFNQNQGMINQLLRQKDIDAKKDKVYDSIVK